MLLFLKAIAPSDLPASEFKNYSFCKSEIVRMCRTALEIMSAGAVPKSTQDSQEHERFISETALSFAKYIYELWGV